ncbi:glyceraldehyde-3-phosphate dehydrogenase [Rhodobacter capsulatus]
MTNTIAIRLGLLVTLAILFDAVFRHGEGFLFLARETFLLIDWIAFWR